LAKYDKNASSIYINSRGSSPNNKESAQQPRATYHKQAPPQAGKSAIKGSISRVNSKSNLHSEADEKAVSMSGSFYVNNKKCLVEGN